MYAIISKLLITFIVLIQPNNIKNLNIKNLNMNMNNKYSIKHRENESIWFLYEISIEKTLNESKKRKNRLNRLDRLKELRELKNLNNFMNNKKNYM